MQLLWSSGALDDLDRIAMFNEQISETRATYVNWRIMSHAATIVERPLRARPSADTIRELSLTDVQYVITYSVSATDVTILGVRSTREQRGHA